MTISQKKISFLRSSLNLTQNEFGKKIGYSRSYVKDIESGRVKPSRGFLEAVSLNFGISMDSLMSDLGGKIVRAIYTISELIGKHKGGFIYLYDFTDAGLKKAEEELLKFLKDFEYKIIECKEIRSANQFLSILTGEKGNTHELWKIFQKRSYAPRDFKKAEFLVLKNFSLSRIKSYAEIFRDLSEELFLSNGSLIVIDKPCFLEKNSDRFYYYAYPIHFSSLDGMMHSPHDFQIQAEKKDHGLTFDGRFQPKETAKKTNGL
jgi:transcriptional regulator with XRE-family HTH domain